MSEEINEDHKQRAEFLNKHNASLDWVIITDRELAILKATIAEQAATIERLTGENKTLAAQSRCNDTDLADAELIAALSDTLLDVTDDEDNGVSGTILSKVQAMKECLIESDSLRHLHPAKNRLHR